MQDEQTPLVVLKDFKALIVGWASGVALALSSAQIWTSRMDFPLRLVATTVVFMVGVAVLSSVSALFIANRQIAKIDPRHRTRRQKAFVVLLVGGMTLATWGIIDTTVAYMAAAQVR